MNAYKITLQCFENDGFGCPMVASGHPVVLITIAGEISEAADFVVEAYTEADEPENGFFWRAVKAEQIEGLVTFPALKKMLPKI